DEAAEVVGAAIYPRGRKEIDAVVAPAKSSNEIGDRHHFEHRDAGGRQLRQFTPGRFPGALARERAHVHLVDYLPFKSGPVPAAARPAKRAGIDELRRPVRPLWLEPRHWIGVAFTAVEAVTIERAGRSGGNLPGEIAPLLRCQLHRLPARPFDHDFD